jgi:hypothetical protein
MVRRATAVLAASVALFAAAPAAAEWEPPRHVLDHGSVHGLEFSDSGRAIAVAEGARFHTGILIRSQDGGWTVRDAGRTGSARLGVHGDRVLLLGELGSNQPRITLTSGDTSGKFGKPRNLGAGSKPALDVHPSGAAVSAWVPAGDGRVVVMRRAAGRPFARPVALGRVGLSGIAAAVNERGEAAVMWRQRNRRTVVATIDREGRAAKPIELGRTGGSDTYALALNDAGRWFAAWITQAWNKYGPQGTPSVSAFSGTLGSRKLSGGQIDAAAASFGRTELALDLDSEGLPLLAWSSIEPRPDFTGYVVRYVTGRADGELAPPQTISLPDRNVFLADLAAGRDGRAVIALDTSYGPQPPSGSQEPPRSFARYRPGSGHPFGPDEALGPGGFAQVAFDPRSDRPLAVWGTLLESYRLP